MSSRIDEVDRVAVDVGIPIGAERIAADGDVGGRRARMVGVGLQEQTDLRGAAQPQKFKMLLQGFRATSLRFFGSGFGGGRNSLVQLDSHSEAEAGAQGRD